MKKIFLILALAVTLGCEKMSDEMHDYLYGDPPEWWNEVPSKPETIIFFYKSPSDTMYALNEGLWLPSGWTHFISDVADTYGECYHDKYYKAYIMIDGRKWVLRKTGYVMDSNTID